MGRGKTLLALTLAGVGATLAGCVTLGRPLPDTQVIAQDAPAQVQEVPLVPVPPPPVGEPPPGTTPPPIATTPPAVPGTTPPPPVEIPPPTPPAANNAAADVTARQLYQAALARYQTLDSFIVRLIRREVVKGEMQPEEVILFKFRKEPFSVYLKWLGKEGQGREVVYVKGQHESKIHTLLAAGDIPLVPAGKRMALAPDNILVRSATRHPITEAGFGSIIEKLGRWLAALDRGDRKFGTLAVVGPVSRPEFARPVYGVEHTLPAGLDASLPKGGKRTYYFDPDSQLPTLIQAVDERGHEVEYYRHDRMQPGVKLDDADFDPERLWPKAKADGNAGR